MNAPECHVSFVIGRRASGKSSMLSKLASTWGKECLILVNTKDNHVGMQHDNRRDDVVALRRPSFCAHHAEPQLHISGPVGVGDFRGGVGGVGFRGGVGGVGFRGGVGDDPVCMINALSTSV